MGGQKKSKRTLPGSARSCATSVSSAKTHEKPKRAAVAKDAVNLDELIKWSYDVTRILQDQLAGLHEDLDSEDKPTRDHAAQEIHDILGWLLPPRDPLSAKEKWEKIDGISRDHPRSLEAIRQLARSTGRPRGRPRTDTSQHAIHALSLFLGTSLSWRQIALKVKGCKHKRPIPERSCAPCGDAIRDAVGRLEKFLRSKGYYPTLPRRVDLDPHSLLTSRRT